MSGTGSISQSFAVSAMLTERSIRMSLELNKEELMIGFIFGMSFWFVFGWWAIPVALLTSLFWAIGGRYGHGWRVWTVPGFVVAMGLILHLSAWWQLSSYPMGCAVLSIGYGMPSTQPPDHGSALGRWWVARVKYLDIATVMTRLTIYALLALAFLPVYLS